jgi:hypothetical protein
MRNLHRILRSALLAATLIAGVGALPLAQVPAQAAAASHRTHAVSGAQYLQVHQQVPGLRMRAEVLRARMR